MLFHLLSFSPCIRCLFSSSFSHHFHTWRVRWNFLCKKKWKMPFRTVGRIRYVWRFQPLVRFVILNVKSHCFKCRTIETFSNRYCVAVAYFNAYRIHKVSNFKAINILNTYNILSQCLSETILLNCNNILFSL